MSLRGFLDNARREASSLATGALPGAVGLLQQGVNDADTLIFRRQHQAKGRFGLDDVAKTMAKEYVRQSPILPLLHGNFGEAAHRVYERPISSSLDFLGAGSVANQGLKLSAHIPGRIGEASMGLRGYDKINPLSLGDASTIGEMPSRFALATGEEALGREYLLRPDIQTTPNGTYARRTMRSPKDREGFDVNIGDTLAQDPLIEQALPRARYEPFAKIADTMDFGPRIGSARFGKRMAIKNRSRLKVSTQEMMAAFGRSRHDARKIYGDLPDPDKAVSDAKFLASAGIMSSEDALASLERFQPSGAKAVLTDNGVDLVSKTGNVFELNHAEHGIAKLHVQDRDAMANGLADEIAKIEANGHTVVMSGNGDDVVLTPDWVRKNPHKVYDMSSGGNLHIRTQDHIVEPVRPGEQGQLIDIPATHAVQHDVEIPLPHGAEKILNTNPDQGRMFAHLPDNLEGRSTFKWVNGEPKYKDPRTDEWVDIPSQHAAYPRSEPAPHLSEEQTLHLKSSLDPENHSLDAIIHGNKSAATDNELAVLHDSTEPVKHDFIDAELRKAKAENRVVDGVYLDSILNTAEHIYRDAAPEIYKKVGKHGVRGELYRHMVNSIKGVDDHNTAIEMQGFDEWAQSHEPMALDHTPMDIPPIEPRDPQFKDSNADPEGLKNLRRLHSENYSKAAWYKNYLDNLVQARHGDEGDIGGLFHSLVNDESVMHVLDSPEFHSQILPAHKLMIAAQLEADKVRLGANALNDTNVVRNNNRLAMLTGKEDGIFFVARKPRHKAKTAHEITDGPSPLEVVDENNHGDPAELIAKGQLDLDHNVHLTNYLRSKREASTQELADTVNDSAVLLHPDEVKQHLQDGTAAFEDDHVKAGNVKTDFVIIRPNGHLFQKIEAQQPLAHAAARRLREDGFYDQADSIKNTADEMYQASQDGNFSLGDMIRNPKLRGEMDDSHYMVPREMYDAILNEVKDSHNALSSFLQIASSEFKMAVLHGRWPGWVANNTIGSQIYQAMTGGLGATIPHAGAGEMVAKYFPDVLGAGSREMSLGAEDLGKVAQSRYDKLIDSKAGRMRSKAVDYLSDANQKIADEPARIERISQVIEDRFQNTQKLAKARGIEIPDTLESRRKMLQDQKVREDIASEVLDDMIDFGSMSKKERMWWSNVIPFYTFVKGSTKSTARLMADHPGRTWFPAQVAGHGSEQTDENFPGGISDYMRALIPTKGNDVLSVGGWNAYGQQAQIFSAITQALNGELPTGQDHPFSMLNPAITIPLEAIQKRDLYTQYPIEGNIAQIMGHSIAKSFPPYEFLKAMVAPGDPSGRSIFVPSRRTTLLNFAGWPTRTVDKANMASRNSADENRRKKDGIYDYWKFHDGV